MAESGAGTVKSRAYAFGGSGIDGCSSDRSDACGKSLSHYYGSGNRGTASANMDYELPARTFLFYRWMRCRFCSRISGGGLRGRKIQGMLAFCDACYSGAFVVSHLVWFGMGVFECHGKHFDSLPFDLRNGQLLSCDQVCGDDLAFT